MVQLLSPLLSCWGCRPLPWGQHADGDSLPGLLPKPQAMPGKLHLQISAKTQGAPTALAGFSLHLCRPPAIRTGLSEHREVSREQ